MLREDAAALVGAGVLTVLLLPATAVALDRPRTGQPGPARPSRRSNGPVRNSRKSAK
jgi:hypothetical protein